MKKNNIRQEWQGVHTMIGHDKINHSHGDDYSTFANDLRDTTEGLTHSISMWSRI